MKVDKVKMACEIARQNTNQSEIAKKCGLHRKTVNNAYNGRSCSKRTVELISNALNIPPNNLVVPEV